MLALVVLAARLATAQPYLVKDVNSRILGTDSSPDPYASIGNVTLFAASSPAQGRELWRTDGTPAGTYLVRDLSEGPKSGLPVSSSYRDAIEGRVYFLGITAEHGRELWVTDGTTAGTKMVADIWPGPAGSFPTAPIATASGNYFVASGETTGFELWKTDGTAAGTKLVVDLNPGITSPSPHILGAVGSRIVFHANDGTRTGLFISDGTAQGTQFIATSAEVLLNTSLNDAIVYTVIAGATRTLMRTDGTAAGTIVLREGFTRIGQSGFTVAGAHAYFFTNHDGAPSEIWRTDGTAAGTQLVTTIAQRASDMEIVAMARLGDRILFSTSGTLGQYWVTDGTAAGTSVIKDAPHNNGEIAVTGAKAYFTASDAAHGSEPWITDGTIEGTRLFADVVVGSAGSDASEFASVGGGVMFAAKSGTTGREPWFADGTEAGTRMLKNVAADHISDSNPREMHNVNGTLFFIADDGFGDTVW
ncbi:MAG TPA: ELWxxDGT repeat protein, partial [Thermoanaerobaculia bacterium]